MNQKSLCKAILVAFVGIAIASCAGTDSSAQNKGNENPSLFKAGTPVADTLASMMPEFARSVFKGTLDSIPGEYYYHVTDDRIDTLFQKEGEQYKPIVSIAYDFFIGQNSFELKKGSYNYFIKDGVLIGEDYFPNYSKVYWDNGKPKIIATGILYKDDQGIGWLDSGHVDMYSENGKVLEQSDWKNKQPTAYKVWNENGILIEELDFPKYFKGYWDNGKTRNVLTGILYRDDQGGYELDSGHSEIYFENGKIYQQNDWKDKRLVAQKEWNENGILIKEIDFPKYFKEYWDNGNLKGIATGLLYRDNQGGGSVAAGRSETYFENGKIKQQNDWNNKQCIAQKEWNENGVLIKEWVFPEYYKEYWDNGKPKSVSTGVLYNNNHGKFDLDSGRSEFYFENGKIQGQSDWKGKQLIAQKTWNENGVLIAELEFPKSFKEYWDNGKLKGVLTGILYRNDQGGFNVDSGHSETYFENGKIHQQNDWKDKAPIASKQWNEKGILIIDFKHSKYAKEYWDNGKPKQILTGILYRNDQGTFLVDSGHAETYFENGKIHQQNDWKDKQGVAQKEWNENGVLVKEWVFPKYFKEYWGSGKPKQILTGLLYRSNQGSFLVDSGHADTYFENGKLNQQNDWKNKMPIASKQWNENGVLTTELDFPKHFKQYWDNGKPKVIATGRLYNNQGNFPLDSGHSEAYFENGKIKDQQDWKNKQLVASKTWNENGVLTSELEFPKSLKKYWNNGKISQIATGVLYRDDQGGFSVDSGHSEVYFENGKINQKNDWRNKQGIASKQWNEHGTLIKELEFPKYFKEYWNNGKTKQILMGLLYRDELGKFFPDSGHSEVYFENGKINQQNDWKNKTPVASKQWNEDGILIKEWKFPKYYKEYWDNGKLKGIMTGILYRDGQGNFNLDSGHSEIYSESGKILEQNDWNNKLPVAHKRWNENGVLTEEWNFSKYVKEYHDNGKIKVIATGILYKNDHGGLSLDSGRSEFYFENEKIKKQIDWKNKQCIAQKEWNENGVLIEEQDFPKYAKEYWDNGKLKQIATGLLYRDDQGVIQVDSGHSELYFENGKINQQNDWKNKTPVASKQWNEDGLLIVDLNFPKYAKEYWNNGKIKLLATGLLYRDDQGNFNVDSGHEEHYFENGEIKEQYDWKDRQYVAYKGWYENGTLEMEESTSKGFRKVYYQNGKIFEEILGKFHYEDGNVILENGTKKQWDENGNLTYELVFPKYEKLYHENGALWIESEGTLYYGDHNNIQIQEGFKKEYYENGKLESYSVYKENKHISDKSWHENGNLRWEFVFPKYEKYYFENGSPSSEAVGTLYYTDEDNIFIAVQDGFRKDYYKNGQVKSLKNYKEKKLIKEKDWYENGTLKFDFSFPNYAKWYYDNGKSSVEMKGTLYYDDQDDIKVQDGFSKAYFENEGMVLTNYKEKKMISRKMWYKNGKIMLELVFPKYEKGYSEKGNLVYESEGTLYYDDKEKIQVHDGFRKWYHENGKLATHKIYKENELVDEKMWYENGTVKAEGSVSRGFHKGYFPDGKIAVDVSGKFHYDSNTIVVEDGSKKWWYENGNLEFELVFPKFAKNYSNNGTLIKELEGTLYYDDKGEIQVQDGFRKEYDDNGKPTLQKIYKGKKLVGKTVWNKSGIVTISVELPNYYKEFYEDEKIKAEATGTIVEEGDSFKIKDGTYKEYSPNGEVIYSATYKDFQVVSEKD